MALGRSGGRQFPIPDEPDQWMTFQRLSALELEERSAGGGDLSAETWSTASAGDRFRLALRWLESCLVAWSYPEPLTEDTRARLDAPTLLWAYVTAVQHNYESESPEEKKSDIAPAIATSIALTAPLPPMSGS